jgi:hypothetical protein
MISKKELKMLKELSDIESFEKKVMALKKKTYDFFKKENPFVVGAVLGIMAVTVEGEALAADCEDDEQLEQAIKENVERHERGLREVIEHEKKSNK